MACGRSFIASARPTVGTGTAGLTFEGAGQSAKSREGRQKMASQQLERRHEAKQPYVGPLAEIPSLGFVTRRKSSTGSAAWRETVTQHVPETWPVARLALPARIAGLE